MNAEDIGYALIAAAFGFIWLLTSLSTATIVALVAICLFAAFLFVGNYYSYLGRLKSKYAERAAQHAAYEASVGKYADKIAAHNAAYEEE